MSEPNIFPNSQSQLDQGDARIRFLQPLKDKSHLSLDLVPKKVEKRLINPRVMAIFAQKIAIFNHRLYGAEAKAVNKKLDQWLLQWKSHLRKKDLLQNSVIDEVDVIFDFTPDSSSDRLAQHSFATKPSSPVPSRFRVQEELQESITDFLDQLEAKEGVAAKLAKASCPR